MTAHWSEGPPRAEPGQFGWLDHRTVAEVDAELKRRNRNKRVKAAEKTLPRDAFK